MQKIYAHTLFSYVTYDFFYLYTSFDVIVFNMLNKYILFCVFYVLFSDGISDFSKASSFLTEQILCSVCLHDFICITVVYVLLISSSSVFRTASPALYLI